MRDIICLACGQCLEHLWIHVWVVLVALIESNRSFLTELNLSLARETNLTGPFLLAFTFYKVDMKP